MVEEKSCDIKGCGNTFRQKARGRLRVTRKRDKGEDVAWICPSHAKELENKIEWRGG